MSTAAFIETNVGKSFRVQDAEGRQAGKALAPFLLALATYCSANNVSTEIQRWFSKLQAQSVEPASFCALAKAFYSGDWNYSEDEYNEFVRNSPGLPLSHDEFVKTLRQVAQIWVDIESLHSIVNEFIRLLQEIRLESALWYDPQWTLLNFQALSQTLSKARE